MPNIGSMARRQELTQLGAGHENGPWSGMEHYERRTDLT
jgi:hypothetical protein